MTKFNAYLAGPIFTYGDLLRNTEWAAKLREAFPEIDLYSPVENTDINGAEGKKKFADSRMVASADNARLDRTDVLFACIDGDVLPAGTCAEIGKFHEKIARGDKKLIVGICTDNRQCFLTHSEAKDAGGAAALGEQQYSYQNIYVTGLIKEYGVLVTNIEDAIAAVRGWLQLTGGVDPGDGYTVVNTGLFDQEELYEDCTVQVLTNTVTGEVSVGWWRNDAPPEEVGGEP